MSTICGQPQTREAISLFGNKNAAGIVILKPYEEYLNEYAAKVAELREIFPDPSGPLPVGETAQKEFAKIYGTILRLQKILTSFDQFENADLLSERDKQNYKGRYMDLYEDWKANRTTDREDIRQKDLIEQFVDTMFERGGEARREQKNRVLRKLKQFFERFSGMGTE